MVIWTRWGILAFLFIGVGVGLGFAIKAIAGFGDVPSGPINGVFVGIGFVLSAVGLYFFERFVVRRHLDKPRPMYVTEQLAQPVTGPDGRVVTQRTVPAVHAETGETIMVTPRSTLFFVPMRFWPFVIAALGVVVFAVNIVGVANA